LIYLLAKGEDQKKEAAIVLDDVQLIANYPIEFSVKEQFKNFASSRRDSFLYFNGKDKWCFGSVFDACGRRMAIRKFSTDPFNFMDLKICRDLELLGRSCDAAFLNFEATQTQISGQKQPSIPIYCSSIKLKYFLTELESDFVSTDEIQRQEVKKVSDLEEIATFELDQRWKYPYLTSSSSDSYLKINEDYEKIIEDSSSELHLITNKGSRGVLSSYLLVQVYAKVPAAVVHFIYVPVQERGQQLSAGLFRKFLSDFQVKDLAVYWMASIANIRSIKSALNIGFKPDAYTYQIDFDC
jgi:hypothetical protein